MKIAACGFRTRPSDPGLISEVKDRVKDASEIAHYGCQTVGEFLDLAEKAKKLKNG